MAAVLELTRMAKRNIAPVIRFPWNMTCPNPMLIAEKKSGELFEVEAERKGARFKNFIPRIISQVAMTNGAVKAGILFFITYIMRVERIEPIIIARAVKTLTSKKNKIAIPTNVPLNPYKPFLTSSLGYFKRMAVPVLIRLPIIAPSPISQEL